MTREWKPEDVAIVTVFGQEHVALMTINGWRNAWAGDKLGQVTDARPLVVIDPDDTEQVDRLGLALVDQGHGNLTREELQAAFRSLIAPPKPDEPQGLGAVVEDADGVLWVRAGKDDHAVLSDCWRCCAGARVGDWQKYRNLDAVRVLSEGVAR